MPTNTKKVLENLVITTRFVFPQAPFLDNKMNVNVYLNFPGTCKDAMNFYKGIFGGDFRMQQTWGESGCLQDDAHKYEEFKDLILHCSLPITPTFTLMASDHHPVMQDKKLVMGNHSDIVLIPPSKAEADRLFAALSDGGSVQMPMQDMFWGSYSGNFIDKFGIGWLIDTPSEGATHPPVEGKTDEKET